MEGTLICGEFFDQTSPETALVISEWEIRDIITWKKTRGYGGSESYSYRGYKFCKETL